MSKVEDETNHMFLQSTNKLRPYSKIKIKIPSSLQRETQNGNKKGQIGAKFKIIKPPGTLLKVALMGPYEINSAKVIHRIHFHSFSFHLIDFLNRKKECPKQFFEACRMHLSTELTNVYQPQSPHRVFSIILLSLSSPILT